MKMIVFEIFFYVLCVYSEEKLSKTVIFRPEYTLYF